MGVYVNNTRKKQLLKRKQEIIWICRNINQTENFYFIKPISGDIKVDVLLQNETIWLPQSKIAELFDVQRPAITKHLKIFLKAESWTKKWYVPFWN
jgi:hypothetical protein